MLVVHTESITRQTGHALAAASDKSGYNYCTHLNTKYLLEASHLIFLPQIMQAVYMVMTANLNCRIVILAVIK